RLAHRSSRLVAELLVKVNRFLGAIALPVYGGKREFRQGGEILVPGTADFLQIPLSCCRVAHTGRCDPREIASELAGMGVRVLGNDGFELLPRCGRAF